jgi:hypothetical protein
VWQFAPLLSAAHVIVDTTSWSTLPAVPDDPGSADGRGAGAVVLRALIDHIGPATASRDLPICFMMATGRFTELGRALVTHYPGSCCQYYGPTETSDDVSLLVLRKPPAEPRQSSDRASLPNVHLLMLTGTCGRSDRAPGDRHGGVGVGEGYWRQPEKTAAHSCRSPYPEIGDLAAHHVPAIWPLLVAGRSWSSWPNDQRLVRGFA